MKKIFLFATAILFLQNTVLFAQSYTLEQLDLSPAGGPTYNTYIMDINNRGFMVGYFTDNNGYNTGFIITRKGVCFNIDNNIIVGSSDVKVVSINDNDVALVSSTMGGVTSLYKIYVVDEDASAPVLVTGLGQNPVNALKINNKNDISGWYQGVNSRWLFILHDSIIPAGMPQWQASRYMPGATYYNTWGNGMDTNNMIAGYYLDAPNFYPFLYNATTDVYQTLTAPPKTKIWDMNNDHIMVGEYQQGNGTYMAFWGDITGNTLNVNSLASIFHTATIQSVANGVNDKGVVVGNFYDPNTSKWKGFIYRPGPGKYEYTGYNFTKHTWHAGNWEDTTAGNTDAHWNAGFFNQYVNYDLFDTYMYNGVPLYDNLLKKKCQNGILPNWYHPDWKSFATESDKLYTPNGTNHDKLMYKSFKKYQLFDKWMKFIAKKNTWGEFNGDCFGFTTTSLSYYCDPNYLNTKYGIPAGIDLSTVSNMDSICKSAITRGQLLFQNKSLLALLEEPYQWFGLYRTKTYMQDTLQKVNLRTLGIQLVDGTDTGWHAIVPYQIRTPQKLPFLDPVTQILQKDTVMIYDPNFPHDSTQYVAIGADWAYTLDSLYGTGYQVINTHFGYPTFTQLENTPFAALKKKTRSQDTVYDFYFSRQTDYIIENGGATCYQLNNTFGNGITKLLPMKGTGTTAFRPLYFIADSVDVYHVKLQAYQDSIMSLTETTDDLSMGIIRKALPAETDNLSVQRKKISYGNPENSTKELTCHYVQTSDGASQSVNLVIDKLMISAFDSIITLSPYDYSYQIIHPGGDSIVYDLELYALYNDTVKHFSHPGIVLHTNSGHLIDPYYTSPTGNQTVIYIDNGLNGGNDDTLFVQEAALDVNEHFVNAPYVSVYPNPAQDELNVSFDIASEASYTIVLADMYGKVFEQRAVDHRGGLNAYRFSVSERPVGTYYVVVYDKDQKAIFVEKLLRN